MNINRVFLMVFVILLGTIGSVSAALVAQWNFSEGSGDIAYDSSANSNDATLYNMAAENWGVADGCKYSDYMLTFDGTGTGPSQAGDAEYLVAPYNTSLNMGDGPFTIAVWLNIDEGGGGGGNILQYGSSNASATTSGKRYTVYTFGGRVSFDIDDNVTKTVAHSSDDAAGNLSGRGWCLLICRRTDENRLEIWVDGAQVGSANASNTGNIDPDVGEGLYIGVHPPDGGSSPFGGEMGTIQLYNHSLTEAEMATMWATSPIAWCPDPADGAMNVPLDANLYWDAPSDANEFWAYDVYIDTDSDLSDVSPIRITVLGSDPNVPNSLFGPMTAGDYWWRVDAVDPNGPTTRTGDVWTFNAGVPLPELVSPGDGSGNQPLELVLDWTSDNTSGLIDHHRLTLTDVTDADGVDHTPVSVDIPALNDNYDLTGAATWGLMQYSLNYGLPPVTRNYTWQIEEIGSGGAVLAVGPVWSFSTVALDCTGLTAWGDLTGDCKANFDDLVALGQSWLECGWQFPGGGAIPYPEKDPCLLVDEQY